MATPAFRFAPSPNGALHLGHAYSAALNHRMAKAAGGRFLVRIEDIDLARADAVLEADILRDLEWLGLEFERPVRRQSDHLADYAEALAHLRNMGLVYPAFMSRSEIRAHALDAEAARRPVPRDPDGVPLYPGLERHWPQARRISEMAAGRPYSWRLDMEAAIAAIGAPLTWRESGLAPGQTHAGPQHLAVADPAVWGDVILARRDAPGSYHLAVVADDALQDISTVVRGNDLYHATAIHRLLQDLLGLPAPDYLHHRLVLGPDGRKLSKSLASQSIRALADSGLSPSEILELAGFEQA